MEYNQKLFFKRKLSYRAYLLNAFYPNTEGKLEVCSYFSIEWNRTYHDLDSRQCKINDHV